MAMGHGMSIRIFLVEFISLATSTTKTSAAFYRNFYTNVVSPPTLQTPSPCINFGSVLKFSNCKSNQDKYSSTLVWHGLFFHLNRGDMRLTCKNLIRYLNCSSSTSVQDWSPHMSFVLKGSQILALQLKGWFKSKNIEMNYKTHIKLVYELYGTCFQYNVKK